MNQRKTDSQKSGKDPGERKKMRGQNRPGAGKGGARKRKAGAGMDSEGHGRKGSEYRESGAGKRKAGTGKKGPGHTKPAAGKKETGTGEEIRLNRYIASSGICSRRDADRLIAAGSITVNGKTVKELGTKVKPGDVVRYKGERIKNERKVYLLLNKPKDYVTTTEDPKERKTVMQLVRNACTERIYPVGRLDRNSTGVLLFTNDGELAKKLTHPGYQKKKIYHVFLDRTVSAGDLNTLATGITLEDGFIQPDAISYANSENKREIGLEIHSGR
ncbi:MAG: pseudouridine synthase, partial [Bacteroidota bacterium]